MGTSTLRPDATLQAGSAFVNGAASAHAALSDSSDLTSVTAAFLPFDGGNGAPNPNSCVVSFANATGTIPAGRQILSVAFSLRGRYNSAVSGGYGAGSLRYSDNIEADRIWADDYPASGASIETNTHTLTSATRWDGGTSKGAWTYALVDALKMVVCGDGGAQQSPKEVFDAWLVVTYSELPAAPTSVTPANGATVTVPNPTLGGTMSAISTGQSQKMEWQFATDSGFTTNVKTVTEAAGDLRGSGATTESPTIANLALTNGTWFMRARAIDQYGIAGPYSSTNTITVSVPALPTPTAVTPAASSTVTTMQPVLGATFAVDAAGRTQKGEWQLATDNTFTTNVRSIIELDADFRASGATTETTPLASKITSDLGTTWYVRARSVGNDGTTSAWSAAQQFTLSMPAPPTPTALTPTAGSTITTNTPTLGATLGAASEGRTSKAEWQLATDAGFTANVRTITENNTDLIASGATTEVIPTASKLFQGTWFIRVRAIDQYGQAGSYTASHSFTVAHQPAASPIAPIGDAAVIFHNAAGGTDQFSWSFSDPASGDSQTAYQVIVERNSDGLVVFDSNKVASTTSSMTTAIPATYKDVKLRWKVRVWDTDDVAGNYSPYQLFTLSDLPVVTVTAPTDAQVITTGQPTVSWTLDGATTQVSRRLQFTKISTGAVIYDTGVQNTSATSYTAPVTILENNTNYSVTVTIVDQLGMTGTATRNFSTQYQTPNAVTFTVDGSGFDTVGYINIDWSSTTADGFFVDWRVYRRLQGTSTWELIFVTTNVSITSYHDWAVGAGFTYEYAVTQSGGRSGLVLESVALPSSPVLADSTHYWLIDPTDETVNLRLANVTADGYEDQYDEAELIIIGRGRKTNQGTRYGYDGSMKLQLRDDLNGTARSKRLKLQVLKDARTAYLLRNPFGDVIQVSLGNLQIERIPGVGTAEFVDVTIPYKEVF